MPRTRMGGMGLGRAALQFYTPASTIPPLCRASKALKTLLLRTANAQRTCQGERALRRRPAPLRVLRKADPGAEAQAGRGREAPHEEALARVRPPHARELLHVALHGRG